jgi:hypothetical protein
MKSWEQLVFERSGLMHMEVLVHALGTQTGGEKAVWRESVVPVLFALIGEDLDGFAVAIDHLFSIYSAPEEWIRADEYDALLTGPKS